MSEFPVIDFSFSKLTDAELAAFKAAGGTGCACYGGRDVSVGKIITPAYFQKVIGMGLDIIPIYEDNATDYLQGGGRGFVCGQAARAGWRDIGLPDDWPIIFGGYDTGAQTNPANWPACFEFMRGFNDGGGNGQIMPAYVGTILGEQLVSRGLAAWIWMPAASSWSNGITANVHMQQTTAQPYGFLNSTPPRYDANRVIQPFYAQYPGGDMPSTLEIVNGVWDWTIPENNPTPGMAQSHLLNAEAKATAANTTAGQAKASADAAKTAADAAKAEAVKASAAAKAAQDAVTAQGAKLDQILAAIAGISLDPVDLVAVREIVRGEIDKTKGSSTFGT